MLRQKNFVLLAALTALIPLAASTAAATLLQDGQPPADEPVPVPVAGTPFGSELDFFVNEDQELAFTYQWDPALDPASLYPDPREMELQAIDSENASGGAPTVVPEPGSMVLLAGGLALLAARRMRRFFV